MTRKKGRTIRYTNYTKNSTNAYTRSTFQKSNYAYIGSTTMYDQKLACFQNVRNQHSRSSTMYTKAVIKHVQQQVKLISYVFIQKFTYVHKGSNTI